VLAERNERRRRLGRHCPRHEHAAAQRLAQTFEPADQIDGGADGGEVEPVGGADIAPQHLAQMKRHAEGQGRQALALTRLIEARHPGPRCRGGAQCRVASRGRRIIADGEDRQHAVADEFQHLAAKGMHRAGDAVEPGIEHRHHVARRHGV